MNAQNWYALHTPRRSKFVVIGAHKCVADNHETAIRSAAKAFPDETIWGAIPGDDRGDFSVYLAGEEFVTCPKCQARTDFTELPFGAQLHACLNEDCGHRFMTEPADEENE